MAGVPCLRWAYGVTTVPSRKDDLLPKTLASLKEAGFAKPRLFVDGAKNAEAGWWEDKFNLEVTARYPRVLVHGNWVLSLYELYLRDPKAERYAILQDDIVCVRNLRGYLERTEYPDGPVNKDCDPGYWNLYASPSQQVPGRKDGFHLSSQNGKGALALVFSRQAVITLLSSPHMAARPCDAQRGWRIVDGGIIDSFRKEGWKEYVHSPSLVRHTGKVSTFDKRPGAVDAGEGGFRWADVYDMTTFPGEEYDALKLLTAPAPVGV